MVLHMFMNAFIKKDSCVSQLSRTRCGGLDSTAVAVNFDFFVTYTLWITAGVWFTLPVGNHPTTTSRGDATTRVGIQGAMPR